MLNDYFTWQYIWGPRWIIYLLRELQRNLWTFFSVPFLLRTLFSYWHRDYISWRGGSLSNLGHALLWNIVSRFIGLFIRLSFLLLWLLGAVFLICTALLSLAFFVLWPWLILVLLWLGFSFLIFGL
jgi:hypothetical protein